MSKHVSAANAGLMGAQRLKLIHAYKALYSNTEAQEPSPADQKHAGPGTPNKSDDADVFFSETIIYRDPFIEVKSLNDYKANFAGLHGMCQDISLDVLSINHGEGTASFGPKSGAKVEMITIDANMRCRINKYINITVRIISKLGLDETGKIESHEDIWSCADLFRNLPFIGSLYNKAQSIIGRLYAVGMTKWYGYRAGVPLKSAALTTHTLHAVYHPIESELLSNKSDPSIVEESGPGAKMRGEHKSQSRKGASGADDRKEL